MDKHLKYLPAGAEGTFCNRSVWIMQETAAGREIITQPPRQGLFRDEIPEQLYTVEMLVGENYGCEECERRAAAIIRDVVSVPESGDRCRSYTTAYCGSCSPFPIPGE